MAVGFQMLIHAATLKLAESGYIQLAPHFLMALENMDKNFGAFPAKELVAGMFKMFRQHTITLIVATKTEMVITERAAAALIAMTILITVSTSIPV